jgi:hypothetical protein
VKALGARASSQRTGEQTAVAIHWAGSEIPPMNAVARAASASRNLGMMDNARLFAHLNMAMADALIAVFDAKYTFDSWRPVTAVRAVAQVGESGGASDKSWEPIMVTPPHPEYPSAHCGAVGAAEAVLQHYFGDKVKAGYVYPPLGVPRQWDSLSQISKEVEDSRVWAGIHFRTAVVHATQVGRQIGKYTVETQLQPAGK